MSWLWSRDVSAAPLLEGAGGRGKLWPSSRDWSILCVTWLNSVKLVMEEKKKSAWHGIFLPKAIIWRLISQEEKYEFCFCPLERCVYLLDTKPRSHSNHNRSKGGSQLMLS